MPGVGEQLEDLGVDVLDDAGEVLAGLDDVVELGGEEFVAFLECLELLEGERVDLAQGGEVLLRLSEAFLLLGAVEVLAGGVVGHEVGDGQAELFDDLGLGFVDAYLRLRAGDLAGVGVVGEPVELGAGGVDAVLGPSQEGGDLGALSDEVVAVGGGAGGGVRYAGAEVAGVFLHRHREFGRFSTPRHHLVVPRLRLAFVRRLAAQTLTTPRGLIRPFLGGAQREVGLHLHRLDLGQRGGGLIAGDGRRFLGSVGVLHAGEAVAGLGELVAQAGEAGVCARGAFGGALVLSLVRLVLPGQARGVALPGGDGLVVFAECGLAGGGVDTRLVGGDAGALEGAGELVEVGAGVDKLLLRLGDLGTDLDRGRSAGAHGDPALPAQDSVEGDHPQAGVLGDDGAGGVHGGGHRDVGEQAGQCHGDARVDGDVVEQPGHPVGQGRVETPGGGRIGGVDEDGAGGAAQLVDERR